MKRRHFLSVSAVGAGAVLLSQCSRTPSSQVQSSSTQPLAQSSDSIASPTVYTSADGLLGDRKKVWESPETRGSAVQAA